jgi:hypothetical protein
MLLLIIDFRQTTKIAKNPDRWGEMNPILGKHPSVKKVLIYFIIVMIITILLPYIIGNILLGTWKDLATIIFVVSTMFEGFVVWRNTKFGLGI